jgi:hypothetical protein
VQLLKNLLKEKKFQFDLKGIYMMITLNTSL